MNVHQTWLLPALMIGFLGCSGPAVRYDYDAKVNFAAYRNYGWRPAPGPVPGMAGPFDNAIMRGRVTRAVEAELAAKGFNAAGGAVPDFLVTYYPIHVATRTAAPHVGMGFGLGPVGLGVAAPVGAAHRDVTGSIVLEIHDFKSGSVVWKATADGVLQTGDSPEEADRAVAGAVKNMLKRFPPKP
jgi:hypothetical protein